MLCLGFFEDQSIIYADTFQPLFQSSSVIVTTPEKWDGISRSWQTRNYVQAVRLIVIDEIHLLGQDRGPVLEVIVSRDKYYKPILLYLIGCCDQISRLFFNI